MIPLNQNLSKAFDLLRFPLAVLVVLLHIQPTVNVWDLDRLIAQYPQEKIFYTVNMIGTKLANCAVPTFFCISGYLLVFNINKLDFKTYFSKIKSRFKTLFIPFIIWNILATAYLTATKQISLSELTLAYVFLSPANFPLWFLRDLITMVMVFPAFYYLAKFGKEPFLILIAILFLFCPFFKVYSLNYLNITSVFFFYAGIFAGYRKWHLDNLPLTVKYAIIVSFMGLLISECVVRGYFAVYTANLYLILAVATVFVGAHWCVDHLKLTAIGILSSSSFFIYCSHKLGPTFLSKIGFHYLNIDNSIVVFIFSPLITAAICISIYFLLQKYCNPLLKFLTGRS